MTSPEPNYGLVRPIPAALADEAREATVLLIAALAAPFPHERWKEADHKSGEEILIWGREHLTGGPDRSPVSPLQPWMELANKIQLNPEDECYRLIRTILTMLSAAEMINSPFVYLGTLVATFPLLQAIVDLFGATGFICGDRGYESWDENLFSALHRTHVVFSKVFQVQDDPDLQPAVSD